MPETKETKIPSRKHLMVQEKLPEEQRAHPPLTQRRLRGKGAFAANRREKTTDNLALLENLNP